MPGESRFYLSTNSADSLQGEDNGTAPVISPELLHTLDFTSIPPVRLHLKVRAPVILLRNLQPEKGLYNSTRLVITRLNYNVLEGRILTGDFTG